ncbi:hypothetical protein K490DRAFT_48598 [Saccharata proteae CBS 121410]|uniref:Nuclear condensin complex subunit 3 C-terminal domain-containing protein n=1 Tax=Saccharata proteae CBS 121410 TaxID=1314787 RepID=A0A9P4HRL3_9PEZI|nr:hypothetical protein K490DRAFT_48598 [Saccharata proteae CBS 121410]
MPGRVAGAGASRRARANKTTTEEAAPARTTTRTSRPRASADIEIPDEGESTSLREQMCKVFADAQRTTATQRKLVISLRKIHEACCYEPANPKKQRIEEDFGEQEFNDEIGRCLIRILPVKKSEPVGDRIIKFTGLFLKHASDKDNAIVQGDDPDATESFPETPTSRLTSHILSLLLPLLTAKDKVVRFRSTQIIAHIINTLDSIDDELFQIVRLGLLRRLRDKESAVRVQAVLGLGRLAGDGDEQEDDDSDDESSSGLLDKLLDILQNDPSAEVRRSLLLNLPLTPASLPYLLERARDLDPGTRRALYSRLLPALGDFRHLSLTHREKLLRWGMRDRDENVRKATARLFRERWIEDCAGLPEPAEDGVTTIPISKPSFDALLELLERIDVANSGVEGGVAHEAMKEFWDGRPDYREYISFDDPFWDELTPESVFVARSFNEYCRNSGDERIQTMAEDKMPEVTKFGYMLQKHINTLIEGVQRVAVEEDPELEEETVQQEFCVEQLLHIALTLDYTDEIGRRKMFSVAREALAIAELPEECTKLVIEILRAVCGTTAAGEREFCGIVLEAVADVHDTIMGEEGTQEEESFQSAQSELSDDATPKPSRKQKKPRDDLTEEEKEALEEEKAVREIMVNMKCLHIAQCMLQNVQCELESNSVLVTMLNNLVVPAVRSQEAPVRERGFLCLGLCCLLSKNIAAENLELFLHCFAKGHEALQTIALQIITDILTTHPTLLSSPASSASPTKQQSPSKSGSQEENPLLRSILKMYNRAMKQPSANLSTNAALAASKLYLLNILRDANLLRILTLHYFNPESASNPGLRQALTYFLPVYCHTKKDNAIRMASVAVPVLHALMGVKESLMDEEEVGAEMIGLSVVAGQLADWTDARKGVWYSEAEARHETVEGAGDAHLIIAEEALEKALTHGTSKEERKTLLSLLSKLHVAAHSSAARLRTVSELLTEAVEGKLAADATSRNALTKLQNAVDKALALAEEEEVEPTAIAAAETTAVDDVDATAATLEETKLEPEEPSAAEEEEEEVDPEEDNTATVTSSSPPPPPHRQARVDPLEQQIQEQLHEETQLEDSEMMDVDMMDVDDEGTVVTAAEGDTVDDLLESDVE